mmetsp:Transcript_17452/g.66011  ORF Transcript_17452/g.66011 Transcript_17452/m.66011 type:complete len:327 (-) Transcript_17452:1616-2596(-)
MTEGAPKHAPHLRPHGRGHAAGDGAAQSLGEGTAQQRTERGGQLPQHGVVQVGVQVLHDGLEQVREHLRHEGVGHLLLQSRLQRPLVLAGPASGLKQRRPLTHAGGGAGLGTGGHRLGAAPLPLSRPPRARRCRRSWGRAGRHVGEPHRPPQRSRSVRKRRARRLALKRLARRSLCLLQEPARDPLVAQVWQRASGRATAGSGPQLQEPGGAAAGPGPVDGRENTLDDGQHRVLRGGEAREAFVDDRADDARDDHLEEDVDLRDGRGAKDHGKRQVHGTPKEGGGKPEEGREDIGGLVLLRLVRQGAGVGVGEAAVAAAPAAAAAA